MKNTLATLSLALILSSSAWAVPWCHQGHIQNVANVSFSEANLMAWANNNIDPLNPPNVLNLDSYIAFHASHEHCQIHAGWSGPSFGVPDAGQVYAHPYAPWSYINTLYGYSISEGLQFHCKKCVPILMANPVRR